MKNIFNYYIAVFAPLLLLVSVFQFELLPSGVAIFLLLAYVFVYRTYIDGLRLVSKGLIGKNDIWKMSTRALRSKHFKELYLKY